MVVSFGQYEVLEEIGRGGMGVIFKARDPRLNRMVAIKQLVLDHVDEDKRDEFRERFRREAILAAGLNHVNLISIYDVSIEQDNSYYVMELLSGHNLRTEVEKRPNRRMSPEDFLALLKQVCAGLSHAHESGLVHRDIKPDNIFLLQGNKVKITDFGIARSQEPDNSNLTKPGVMLGTLAYVSPEQLQDARNVDHRADIYSLAVVTYEALCGHVPFAGDGLTSTLMAIISKEPKPLNEVNPEISNDIAAVVAKAMRKKAEDRYGTADEFEKEFERAILIGRSGGGSTISTSRGGITAINSPGRQTGSFNTSSTIKPAAQPLGEELPKAGVKPWLAGRTGESAKVHLGSAGAISQSVALVKAIGQFGRHGEERGCFMEPNSISARAGKIVVSDAVLRKFVVFSRDGRVIGELKTVPKAKGTKTDGGAFSKPAAVALDFRGRIIGVDSTDHFIRIYDGQGSYLKDFINKHGKGGGLSGVICDSSGYIYVADPDNGCIQVYQGDVGNWIRKVGSKGTGDGQLQYPTGLTLDRFGQLLVVDFFSSKVSIFSKAGMFQRNFGGKGTTKGLFNVPRGVAVDRYDRIYVADSLNHKVQVFSPSGDYLFSFGGRGNELGRFIGPAAVSVDPDNNCLYVVDKGNCRIQIFEIHKD